MQPATTKPIQQPVFSSSPPAVCVVCRSPCAGGSGPQAQYCSPVCMASALSAWRSSGPSLPAFATPSLECTPDADPLPLITRTQTPAQSLAASSPSLIQSSHTSFAALPSHAAFTSTAVQPLLSAASPALPLCVRYVLCACLSDLRLFVCVVWARRRCRRWAWSSISLLDWKTQFRLNGNALKTP